MGSAIPTIDQRVLRVFRWFVRKYVGKRFHSLAVNSEALSNFHCLPSDSLVVYANHPSWWDPLTALLLADKFFPQFKLYAPIDAAALSKYRMFARLGFFGVDQRRREGAVEFLRISRQILAQPNASIWITPEGRFADIRDTQTPLAPGLGHLAATLARAIEDDTADSPSRVWFVPGAVEYVFWEEPRPEILCWFGEPLLLTKPAKALDSEQDSNADSELHKDAERSMASRREGKLALSQQLTDRLRAAQNALAEASMARDSSQFQLLLDGSSGTFFIYDWWRKGLAFARGQRMRVDHGEKLRAPNGR